MTIAASLTRISDDKRNEEIALVLLHTASEKQGELAHSNQPKPGSESAGVLNSTPLYPIQQDSCKVSPHITYLHLTRGTNDNTSTIHSTYFKGHFTTSVALFLMLTWNYKEKSVTGAIFLLCLKIVKEFNKEH